MDPEKLEEEYTYYMSDLKSHLPDGIVEVDLELLQELNLLAPEEEQGDDLTENFFVVESADKLTLFNQKYAVWIVPQMIQDTPTTLTLIALNNKPTPQLEMVFSTTGVYNHSTLVLKLLEKFLEQIEENEEEICKFTQE